MYSMSIILLELACWKPAEELLGVKQPPKPTEGKDTGKDVGGKNEPLLKQ